MSGLATRSFLRIIAVSLKSALILISFGATSALHAQTQAPAGYIYVASTTSSNEVDIYAYKANLEGRLAPVAGSPFSTDLQYGAAITVRSNHLFATDGIDINSYSVASDGAIQQVASIDAQGFNPSNCGGPMALFLDRTGTTLYDLDIYSDCANNGYQFFSGEGSSGDLNYLGVTAAMSPVFATPLSFLGNNQYAYGASCYHWYQEIFGFVRESNGTLTDLKITAPMPASKTSEFYCPGLAAADGANHLAVPVQAMNNSTLQPVGSGQLATYTADTSGNLITKSTYSNMPTVGVGTVTGVSMSPSGKLLAVSGTGGLQVFHFNGGNAITHYTGSLTTDSIEQVDQIAWDNNNHLYAVSQSAGKLFVFTITPTSYRQAAGSPYSITGPVHIAALPR